MAAHSKTRLDPFLVDESEAARLLCVSPRFLQNLRNAGEIPFKRLGTKKIVYPVAALRAWANGEAVATSEEAA